MEALGKVSTRLTWRHKAFLKAKLLSQHTDFIRGYTSLHCVPQKYTQLKIRFIPSQVYQVNICASCLKRFTDRSYNITQTMSRSFSGVTWTLSRSFSEHSDGQGPEDYIETQKEVSKSKTLSVKSGDEYNQTVPETVEVLPSIDNNDDSDCDKLNNDVLKSNEDLRLDATKNAVIKPSQDKSENSMEHTFDKVSIRTDNETTNSREGDQFTAVYGEDSDVSESDDSDDNDVDLFSDSDSDSNGSGYDTEDFDRREKAGSKDLESGSDRNVLELLPKEGFTTEEMIEHIDRSDEIMKYSIDENLPLLDERDEISEELHDMKGNMVTDGDTSSSDLSPDTTKSRHFDEKGVVSFIDMEEENSKSRDWSVEEIEDFVNISVEHVEEAPWQPPISLERGLEGVFDIEDLVLLVRNENLVDVVTLRIPPEKHFGDYMVIGTAKSFRHMRAVCEAVNWIYKQRKSTNEKFLKQEGKQDDSGWIALDLGNIILHIFLKEERELYDLETLWSVGSTYDDQCQEQEDPYALSLEDHPWLKELEDLQNINIITTAVGQKK